ncbi:MAG: ABC transporter permease subunit [Deltaproteobacteria bacterium]|nr:ABC transporter permease subunit [Deltaproteobacteria bacterium]
MNTLAITAIAENTVRDAVRNKVLYILLFFALVLIGASFLLATLSYVERERILQDIALASIRIFGAAIAIFIGVSLVHREVDRRTIFTILSKPVSRADFLIGKYLGLVTTLWLQLAIMSAGFVLVSWSMGAPLDGGHAIALAATALELAVLVAIATLFSSFATPFLAACYSIGLYVVGHITRDIRALGEIAESGAAKSLTVWIHRIFPDLESFNWTIEAVHGLPIPPEQVAWSFVMGIGWCIAFLTIAVVVFERRDFR